MTNVVAQHLFNVKGVHFYDWKMHLHREGKTVAWVKPLNGHFLLEDNTEEVFNESFATGQNSDAANENENAKSAPSYQWHQMLAHASNDAIQHLQVSAEGVKIANLAAAPTIPKTNEYETCALSKMHRIISSSAENAETAALPFHRIAYDLIPLNPSYNKDEWVSHFACHWTDFNMVFTYPKKSDATRIVKEALNLIETGFNGNLSSLGLKARNH